MGQGESVTIFGIQRNLLLPYIQLDVKHKNFCKNKFFTIGISLEIR